MYYICCLNAVFRSKDLLEIFPILRNNCREMGNMRTGTEIVNPCVKIDECLICTKCLHFKYTSEAMGPKCISEAISV